MPEQPRSERKTQNRLIGLFTEAGAGTSVKTSVKGSVKTSVKTSEKVLQAILENAEITISVLADRVGITTRSVERNIRKLQEAKRLRRIGPDTNQFIRKWTSPKHRWLLGARASRAHFVAIHTVLRAGRARSQGCYRYKPMSAYL